MFKKFKQTYIYKFDIDEGNVSFKTRRDALLFRRDNYAKDGEFLELDSAHYEIHVQASWWGLRKKRAVAIMKDFPGLTKQVENRHQEMVDANLEAFKDEILNPEKRITSRE